MLPDKFSGMKSRIDIEATSDEVTLYAFYDLRASPVTFDFFQFLILADLDRKKRGLNRLHIVIIPESPEVRREWLLDRFDKTDVDWRVRQILVPGCSLMPSCRGLVTVCGSRDEADKFFLIADKYVFPEGCSVNNPIPRFQLSEITAVHVCGEEWSSLKATGQAIEMVRTWMDGYAKDRRVVSITLREADYGNEKNSNIAEWAKFAKSLDTRKYLPVIIRDTYAVNGKLPDELIGLTMFNEIAINLELRMAFYEECYLNLLTNGGPLALCMLNKNVKFLSFKPMVKRWHDSTARGLQAAVGVGIGDQPHFSNSYQRWVWADDDYEVIRQNFTRMEVFIEAPESQTVNGEVTGFFAINSEPVFKVAKRLDKFRTSNSAAVVLRHCLENDPKNLALRLRVAVNETWIKNFEQAAGHYQILLKADPETSRVRLCYADFLAVQSRIEQAIAAYYYGIMLEPTRVEGFLKLALVLEKMENLDKSLLVLRQGISLDPCNGTALRQCSRVLSKLGEELEAEGMLLRANEIYPVIVEEHL
jgi:tetratricopeptide (TPR) repeat protein